MTGKALRYFSVFALLALALALSVAAEAQEPQASQPKIDWQRGPTVGDLGGMAQIKVPEGYAFADKRGAEQVTTTDAKHPQRRGDRCTHQPDRKLVHDFPL